MVAALDLGNPSSVHREGRLARAALETSRAAVAAFAEVAAESVVFTSGATEALATLLRPRDDDVLLLAACEHLAVVEGHGYRPAACEILPVDANGVLRLDGLEASLRRHAGRRVTLALQSSNNETGVVQPVGEAAALVHACGGRLVCDAVQSAGKVEFARATRGADAVVLSLHKFGGPKGVGAICWRTPDGTPSALLRGGGQERGARAGTENVAGIVGAGVAARAATERAEAAAALCALRDAFEADMKARAPDVVIFGADVERLPNTTAFAVPGVDAQLVLMALDVAGVAASSGSACTSGKVKPSHVLAAMGVDPTLTRGLVRISLGPGTAADDLARTLEILDALLKRARPRAAAA